MQKYVKTNMKSQTTISLVFIGQWLIDISPTFNQLFDSLAKKINKKWGSEIILLFP